MEETNSTSVIYPVALPTSDQATVLPFLNKSTSYIDVVSELPTATRTGRAISFDLKTSVKTILTNVSGNQFFGYPNYIGDTRFYKIGTLNLPLNGHQAVITVNLCYGFNVNNTGLNLHNYNIQNYEMKI